uniref:Secreted protein n=1 Tax=Anguilla anguilla TaxID=7936 RepID=A0A0E9S5T1_ANGAN
MCLQRSLLLCLQACALISSSLPDFGHLATQCNCWITRGNVTHRSIGKQANSASFFIPLANFS